MLTPGRGTRESSSRRHADASASRAGEEGETMSHIPVNHHLRPLYRALAVLTAVYVLIFGVVGVIQTAGSDPFARDDLYALGLRTNLAFSIASLAAGVLILLSAMVGRGLYYLMGVWGGVAFMVVGATML